MADNKTNGSAAKDQSPQQPVQLQARLISQYVKDLSFENPNIRKLITGPGDPPSINVEVGVSADKIENDLYESLVMFKATASNNIGSVYLLEVEYAGMFKIESVPEQALEPFLLISGPTMLFPFLRRLVADVTREGGFPPLMLDPIDFGNLYFRRKQQEQEAAGKTVA